MIRLVAFDLDGTIGDTIPMCIRAFRKAVEPYVAHELSEREIVSTFGLNEEGMIRQVAGSRWKEALEKFYPCYVQMHDMCPSPFCGMKELIKKLKDSSVLTALITGKGERSCLITLQKFGMEHFFDAIETGAPYKNRKSEAIGCLLKQFRLRPDEMLYIGDAVSDVLSCREAGVRCLSAVWAQGCHNEELLSANAGNIMMSISDLKQELENLNVLHQE